MTRVRVFTIVCAALAIASLLVAYKASLPSRSDAAGVASERARIAALFSAHSPAQAFELFKTAFEKRSVPDQHVAAHMFGEILYEREGLQGLSVCDGSFGFGCYHTFIGLAIAEHGPEVVKKLDESCVSAYGPGGTGCFHGIGHGLLSYYGYGFPGVTKALSLCASLSWQRPLGGCSDGVFMEYNFRTMETDPAARNRPFQESARYEPCVSVEAYREGCYFALPAWWATALPRDESLPHRMGALCAAVENANLRRACYRGIGYGIVPTVHFEAPAGETFCDSVASGEARTWCREGLAWAFYADPNTRSLASSACTTGLPSPDALQCTREYLFVIQ